MPFPYYRQLNNMDCGATCLRMIAKYHGKHYNAETLRHLSGYGKEGVSLLGISEAAEKIGFRTRGVKLNLEQLSYASAPAILHWNQNHFVVLIKFRKHYIEIADPARGILRFSIPDFQKHWLSSNDADQSATGTALLIEPSPAFYEYESEKENKLNWSSIGKYLIPEKGKLTQIFIALALGSGLQLVIPFLTQSMVDTGINARNMEYITLVLIAQLVLTFSNSIITFIRSRIQMRLSNTLNLSILSDFWIKLTRLPVSYFDARQTGDTMQRLSDNRQVQNFITSQAMTSIFSLLNFLIYSIVLVFYSVQLFLVFTVGNLLYFGWIRLFLRARRKINYETFHLSSKENNTVLQLVQGMQEIRLNNSEKQKRWEWEDIQARIFKLSFKSLNYSQWQSTGALFITQGKDIVISFLVAEMVVKGQLTFGTMLAVQYIIGQMNGPIQQLIQLTQSLQDAKISMERLNEVHQLEDEEPAHKSFTSRLPEKHSIQLKDFTFTYPGAGNDPVLHNINLLIPEGKTTAIVGVSGSGKTTLLKILLRIYDNYNGEIRVGDSNLKYISPSFWRRQCGAVMQDGYIFNDTIGRNISMSDEYVDQEKLLESCRLANILSFVESLPNGFNTKIGADGTGISQGQRQRLLIARAIYKDPSYMFFDEATNSLDANNEKAIVENLQSFFAGRTIVIVAHRLSTVKNADHIVVMKDGKIAEMGDHASLTALRGNYYELVKNQLELGN